MERESELWKSLCISKSRLKKTLKKEKRKQAAITKRVDISSLRHSSNAETQTDRINSML